MADVHPDLAARIRSRLFDHLVDEAQGRRILDKGSHFSAIQARRDLSVDLKLERHLSGGSNMINATWA